MGRKFFRSVTAWALIAAVTTAFTLMPAGTASAYAAEKIGDGVSPTCDEAYYATMDYYGNLTEGSVVKSYAMNGVNKLTDYDGWYSTEDRKRKDGFRFWGQRTESFLL